LDVTVRVRFVAFDFAVTVAFGTTLVLHSNPPLASSSAPRPLGASEIL
jgi:hypothetical protein